MSAQPVAAPAATTPRGDRSAALHVFTGDMAEQVAADSLACRLAVLIDPGFLTRIGWDRQRQELRVSAAHPLLGERVCRVPGCDSQAKSRPWLCFACRTRLSAAGVDIHGDFDPAALPPRPADERGICSVRGCRQARGSAGRMLCCDHHRQRLRAGQSVTTFLTRTDLVPMAPHPPCQVIACDRQRVGPESRYCGGHRKRWRIARARRPELEERQWQTVAAPLSDGGTVVMRGLRPAAVAGLLLALQGRIGDGLRVRQSALRGICLQLRAQQAATLDQLRLPAADHAPLTRQLTESLLCYLDRALLDPETERVKDTWDLAAFGKSGWVCFTSISQPWLREAAKIWALDDLHRRRGSKQAGHLRQRIGWIARMSASLAIRSDSGAAPAALGRGDIDLLLDRLAMAEADASITRKSRIELVEHLKLVLVRMRMLGATRPGGPAAGLSEDFALDVRDVPERPARGEPCRDLPAEIMTQLCANLNSFPTPGLRIVVELLIDTGRRPQEICRLPCDCLARDSDGGPVLVYENLKAYRRARRLPIAEPTAQLIIAQQQRVRIRYPDTPIGRLALIPTPIGNPGGTSPIATRTVSKLHREWVDALPQLRTADGRAFDRAKVIPYAYRHTYAQRHADAGVAPDVLRELMDHRMLETTKEYYRVGDQRRRQAVDRLTGLHFDRHGNRIWRTAQTLLDSEHARLAVGEVAVPFGTCAEPSNVQAAGHACPFRFRCLGCDHFRTDVSYLPDLRGYLDDLLRTRERLRAATTAGPGLDAWAAAEAMPSDEEIARLRALIARISGGLEELSDQERAQVEQAITGVRATRTVTLGMPGRRPSTPDHCARWERTA